MGRKKRVNGVLAKVARTVGSALGKVASKAVYVVNLKAAHDATDPTATEAKPITPQKNKRSRKPKEAKRTKSKRKLRPRTSE
jgi:hypothetical protein